MSRDCCALTGACVRPGSQSSRWTLTPTPALWGLNVQRWTPHGVCPRDGQAWGRGSQGFLVYLSGTQAGT